MEEMIIQIQDVSKEYQLGTIGRTTLRDEWKRRKAKRRNEDDPTAKLSKGNIQLSNERFLALDGVSFTVNKGEAIGLIGHNGAGKSTLLKLITRITAPTKGAIRLNGRVASMLEVGTGFHDELTGRENIYLNGAILGMTKKEIDAKMEDIIEFSECRKFIDTPVKRYSSGMKVKLGFSVAAHLDSEIMIMDEVLAVGDVNFQNKCIKKMREVANSGKTILYVSHNMSTIRHLCDRCVVLGKGKKIFDGSVEDGIAVYMKNSPLSDQLFFDTSNYQRRKKYNLEHKLLSLEILNEENAKFDYGQVFLFRIRWQSDHVKNRISVKCLLSSIDDTPVGVIYCGAVHERAQINSADFYFNTIYLFPGKYVGEFVLYDEDEEGNVTQYDHCPAIRFEIVHSSDSMNLKHWFRDFGYTVLPCITSIKEHL